MLPSDLLIHRPRGDSIDAKQLPLNEVWIEIATNLISLFQATVGDTQGNLNQKLQALEGEDTDYRIKRGLAHILRSSFSTFEIVSPLEPQELRQRVFAQAAASAPSPTAARLHLETLANHVSGQAS